MNIFELADVSLTLIQVILTLFSSWLHIHYQAKLLLTTKRSEHRYDPEYNKGLTFIIGVGLTLWSISGITQPLRDPTIVMHGGRWVIAILFSFMLIVGQWNIFVVIFTTFDKPVATSIFLLESMLIIVSSIFFGFTGRANHLVDEAANKICSGSFILEATPYDDDTTTHPIVLFYTRSERGWKPAEYPQNWLPKSVKEIQLVACIDDDWRIIETCYYRNEIKTYTGNEFETLYRKQLYRTVRVVEAITGKNLDTSTQTGSLPPECEFHEVFVGLETVRVKEGNSLPSKTLFNHLEQFVNP
jgi:hypothetical protein